NGEMHGRWLSPRNRLGLAGSARERRQIFVKCAACEMRVRGDVRNVVALVVRRRDRVVQLSGRVPERCVDEPTLPAATPNGPPEPRPGILSLPVPLEVPDVAGLKADGVAIVRTQNRDAC